MAILLLLLFSKLLLCDSSNTTQVLNVKVGDNASFTVNVNGDIWFESIRSSLYVSGMEHSLEFNSRIQTHGSDQLGAWTADEFHGVAGHTRIQVAIKVYNSKLVTFDITLPDGATHTQRQAFNISTPDAGNTPPSLDFPSFRWDNETNSMLPKLGLLTIQGDQLGYTPWTWGSEGQVPSNVGRASGPFIVFEDPRDIALAICPLTNFHVATSHLDTKAWRWGPSGELLEFPAGFIHRTLIVLGDDGVTSAWAAMGHVFKTINAEATVKRLEVQKNDLNLQVLSYYTDAGDEFLNGVKEAELINVIKTADMPFGLVQLDDWSHLANNSHPVNCGCLENWTANPAWFSDGWLQFSQKVNLPLDLYLPGAGLCPGAGKNNFNVSTLTGGTGDGTFEVPTPEDALRFFRELIRQGLSQGMGNTFEIDFLWFQFLQVTEWRATINAFPTYFNALGDAAREQNTAVELCMSFPLHILSAASNPFMTSTRVGPDYDWPTNCNIGISSFLPWSVGLHPSKDSFMSSNRSKVVMGPPFVPVNGTGNPMALPELNAIIAAFSTGPVGVGDGLNATDADIVLPTCDKDGGLLQPDRPLLAIDATFCKDGQDKRGAPNGKCKSTWMSAADGGAVWNSLTVLNDTASKTEYTTHFALAINVSRVFPLLREDVWPRASKSSVYVSRIWQRNKPCINGSDATTAGCVAVSSPGSALVPNLQSHSANPNGYTHGESPFVLVAVHKILGDGWAVWEDGKYVSVSSRRFKSIRGGMDGKGLTVHLQGAKNEKVELVALKPKEVPMQWTVLTLVVALDSTGEATITFT
eukprot:m.343770 g.343770  ORF g.343770 m.343770 type:complete len:809 (+) comp23276_c0_seq1:128-2554(+)